MVQVRKQHDDNESKVEAHDQDLTYNLYVARANSVCVNWCGGIIMALAIVYYWTRVKCVCAVVTSGQTITILQHYNITILALVTLEVVVEIPIFKLLLLHV